MVLPLCALYGEGLYSPWATLILYPKLLIESGEERSEHRPFCQATAFSPWSQAQYGDLQVQGAPWSPQLASQVAKGIALVRAGPVQ